MRVSGFGFRRVFGSVLGEVLGLVSGQAGEGVAGVFGFGFGKDFERTQSNRPLYFNILLTPDPPRSGCML